jgi:hypothetical protein
MTVYSKHIYEDKDDGRILKASRKQQHDLFPAPIAFLNDELKAELGMKSKKEEEEDDAKFCSLKVPMDHGTKNQKPTLSRSRNMIQERQKRFWDGVWFWMSRWKTVDTTQIMTWSWI